MKEPYPICIIIPVYNEEKRFKSLAFQEFIEKTPHIFFVFIDDASDDHSYLLIRNLHKKYPYQTATLKNVSNKGKANSIHKGFMYAKSWMEFNVIGYWDADLSTPLEEISLLLEALRNDPNCIVCMGSRKSTSENNIYRLHWRHLLGRGFTFVSSRLFALPFYDTQCGAKLIRTPFAYQVCEEPFVSRWLVDIEILLRLKDLYPEGKFCEVVLRSWTHQPGSKMRIKDLWKIIYEIRKVYIYFKNKP